MIPCLWTSFKSIFRQDDLPELNSRWMGVINIPGKSVDAWETMDGLQICMGSSPQKNASISRPKYEALRCGFWGVNFLSICRILGAIPRSGDLSQPLVTQEKSRNHGPKKPLFSSISQLISKPQSGIRIILPPHIGTKKRMKRLGFFLLGWGRPPTMSTGHGGCHQLAAGAGANIPVVPSSNNLPRFGMIILQRNRNSPSRKKKDYIVRF